MGSGKGNVMLYQHTHTQKDGTALIYVRTRINKKYVFLNTNVAVKPSNYDHKNQKVTGEGAKQKNLILKECAGRVADIVLKYQVNEKVLTKDILEKEYYNPSALGDFFTYMNNEIDRRAKGDISHSVRKHHKTTLRKFKAYTNKNELQFAEVDWKLLEGFQRYLRSNKKNSINTTHNDMKTLKTYILRAINDGLIKDNPFENIKLKKEKKLPEFLTTNELRNMWKLYNSNKLLESHKKVLRWFLFSTETGLRISDIRRIEHDNIINNMLVFTPYKTREINNIRVDVPLTRKAWQLISDEGTEHGKIFLCYSEQKMRKYLKESLPSAGIHKNLSFHAGRHTFATQFLQRINKANGILILQKLLGHANLSSTMGYLHVLNNDIVDAMQEFQKY